MGRLGGLRRDVSVWLLIVMALAVGASIMMGGCGNKTSVETLVEAEDKQEGGEVEQGTSQSAEEPEEEQIEIQFAGMAESFSEDRAWVKFSEDGSDEKRWGCIDKKGSILFAFPEGYDNSEGKMIPTPYENGYSYISYGVSLDYVGAFENKDSIEVIDSAGNLSVHYADQLGDASNVEKEDRSIVAYGSGYFVLYRHQESDFENDDYPWVYEVYDAEGNYIDNLSSHKSTYLVRHCGQGVFEFESDEHPDTLVYFFPKTDKFIMLQSKNDLTFVDGEDTALVDRRTDIRVFEAVGDEEWKESTLSGLVVVSTEGELSEHQIPEGVEVIGDNPRVSEGKVVLAGSDTYYIYELDTKNLKAMPEKYAKHGISSSMAIFHDGVLATRVSGADGQRYLSVFDADWNRLFEPVKLISDIRYYPGLYYSDGQLSVSLLDSDDSSSIVSIDKKGGKVFEASRPISQSIDDVIMISDKEELSANSFLDTNNYTMVHQGVPCTLLKTEVGHNPYLALDGQPLFESLNVDNMRIISHD